MKLFYVEHQVVTTARFALIAEDEADLARLLEERKAIVEAVPFAPKIERDKAGKVQGHQLSEGWPYAPHGTVWSGKL